MKGIFILGILLVNGCSFDIFNKDVQIVVIPTSEKYPIFPISEYSIEEDKAIKVSKVTYSKDSNKETKILMDYDAGMIFINDYKRLKGNYNNLIFSVMDFNNEIKKLNEKKTKPYFIDGK